MSNAMTLFSDPAAQVPAHIAQGFEGHDNVLPRDTTPALTFRGKTWRVRQGGEEIILTTMQQGERVPAQVVKIVVLDMSQKRARAFYAKGFVEGQNQSPSCWSSDGERPDADVPVTQKCAATCASCPNSVKGSKITDNGKETAACAPLKRLAVVPGSKLDMEPLLLKVPQTSLWDKNNEQANAEGYFAWDQYVDFLRQRGVKHTAAVITKVKFDPTVAYPKLLFTAERWLQPEELVKVRDVIGSDPVKKLLTGKIHEGGEEATPEGAAPAPVTAPAAAPAAVPPPVAAPAPPPAPIAARAPAPAAEDGDDGFASVGAPQTAPAAPTAAPAAAPAAAPKATRAPAPPRAPAAAPAAPAAPVPPKPATIDNAALADLAKAWDD